MRRIALSGRDSMGMPVMADDHGNERASATWLDPNSSYSGRIETASDEDWFYLETSGPRDVSIHTTGSLNTVGALFDGSGRKLASDDDGRDGFNFTLTVTLTAGVYYVRVKGHGSATGSYTIHENGQASVQPSASESGTIRTVAGTGREGYSGDGGPATIAQLNSPVGVATDPAGNLYVAERYNHRVRKVDRAGVITTVAGTGVAGYGGDGGPAGAARLDEPADVVVDAAGNLYISEFNNSRVRRVDRAGVITTVAGTGVLGFSGDGGPAASAQLHFPAGVAVDASGNLYVADAFNHRVRRVDRAGVITTVAGSGPVGEENGGYGGDGRSATSAQLHFPAGVTVDRSGNLYVTDAYNHRVRRVDRAGMITTVAGTGREGYGGDGGPAAIADLALPNDVVVDATGNLFVSEGWNHQVRKVDLAGVITTVAGTGEWGYRGDGGQATSAHLSTPVGMAVDAAGNLYIADAGNHRVRRVTGIGDGGSAPPVAADDHGNDAVGATRLALNSSRSGRIDTASDEDWFRLETSGPRVVRVRTTGGVDTFGTLFDASNQQLATDDDGGDGLNFALESTVTTGVYYVRVQGFGSDTGSYTIHENGQATMESSVSGTGVITTVAGTGERGYGGDGGPAASAQLSYPADMAVDGSGNLYIADSENHRVRRVNPSGAITTVAGTGVWGYGGDGGPAASAQLAGPEGVAVDAAGNLYIAEAYAHRVRKVDRAGVITTFAGTGLEGYGGDGGPAASAPLAYPEDVAVDGAGNLFITDEQNHRVRKVDTAGVITTVAGTGEGGYSGDGGPAASAQIYSPEGVAVDTEGNLYIADKWNHRVRKVDAAGVITTVAGTGVWGYGGDGGPAASALLDFPEGVVVDAEGNLYIAEAGNHRVRRVDVSRVITTVAGTGERGHSGDGDQAASAQLAYPEGVAVDAAGNLYVADAGNHRVRKVTFGGAEPRGSDTAGGNGLAPADEPAFNSRMVGKRIISQILSVDFVSAGRFILSGRFAGSYSYSSTGSDTGTVTLTFDSGGSGIPGGFSFDLAFTFTSASRGSMTQAGSRFDWILSSISEPGRPPPPLFPDRSGSQLDFFIFDVFRRQESRAYDVQLRRKTTPPSRWQTGCIGADPPTPDDLNFNSIGLFATGVPQGTHQLRYRHRNSSRCGSGTPGEWSEIGEEGVTRWPW